jgi:hypothetical protein
VVLWVVTGSHGPFKHFQCFIGRPADPYRHGWCYPPCATLHIVSLGILGYLVRRKRRPLATLVTTAVPSLDNDPLATG